MGPPQAGELLFVGLPQVQVQYRDERDDNDQIECSHSGIIAYSCRDCKPAGRPEEPMPHNMCHAAAITRLGRRSSTRIFGTAGAAPTLARAYQSFIACLRARKHGPLHPMVVWRVDCAYTPKAFCICWRTCVRRLTSPPPTSAVTQPVKPISSRALRTSAHGKSSSSPVISVNLPLARL